MLKFLFLKLVTAALKMSSLKKEEMDIDDDFDDDDHIDDDDDMDDDDVEDDHYCISYDNNDELISDYIQYMQKDDITWTLLDRLEILLRYLSLKDCLRLLGVSKYFLLGLSDLRRTGLYINMAKREFDIAYVNNAEFKKLFNQFHTMSFSKLVYQLYVGILFDNNNNNDSNNIYILNKNENIAFFQYKYIAKKLKCNRMNQVGVEYTKHNNKLFILQTQNPNNINIDSYISYYIIKRYLYWMHNGNDKEFNDTLKMIRELILYIILNDKEIDPLT